MLLWYNERMDTFEDFREGYVEAMLWANTYSITGEELAVEPTVNDLDSETQLQLSNDARTFYDTNLRLLTEAATARPWSHLGHDFALTRNRHGAGFWDRGLGTCGEKLTVEAQAMGESNLFVDDDGIVYCE